MKKLFLLLVILIVSAANFLAQSKNKELEALREETNLPDKEIIRVNKKIKFPNKKPLKIYLAINQSEKDAKKFEKWIGKWNKKNATKYGQVELVSDNSKADVIVAQYRVPRSKYVKESKVTVGNVSETGKILPKAEVDSEYSYRRLDLPIYSYLLVRSNGFWTIVFQNVEPVFVEEQYVNPYARLRGALKKRLKKR